MVSISNAAQVVIALFAGTSLTTRRASSYSSYGDGGSSPSLTGRDQQTKPAPRSKEHELAGCCLAFSSAGGRSRHGTSLLTSDLRSSSWMVIVSATVTRAAGAVGNSAPSGLQSTNLIQWV